MSKQTEALKLALEGAANYIDTIGGDSRKYRQALANEALERMADNARELGLDYDLQDKDPELYEQPAQQEPVAWQVMVEDEAMKEFSTKDIAHDWCVQQKLSGSSYTYWIRPLYTRPLAREWVGLTDVERNKLWREVVGWGDPSHDDEDLMKAIEAKLMEKNA